MSNHSTAPQVGDLRIIRIGYSYEVQRYSGRNEDGYYVQDWRTIRTFWDEDEAKRYVQQA